MKKKPTAKRLAKIFGAPLKKKRSSGSMERVVSLRPEEVTILLDHYEACATSLEQAATQYQRGSQRDQLLDQAGKYQSRANELRQQTNNDKAQRPTPTP